MCSDLAACYLKKVEIICREIIIDTVLLDCTDNLLVGSPFPDEEGRAESFWAVFRNNTICMLIIRWCQVLGNDSEESHWKKLPGIDIERTRRKLITIMEGQGHEWSEFHKRAVDVRNYFIAHTSGPAPNVFKEIEAFKVTASLIRDEVIMILKNGKFAESVGSDYQEKVTRLPTHEVEMQAQIMCKQGINILGSR